jgi:hypothetical protein
MKFPHLKIDKETIGIGVSIIGVGITIYEIHRRNVAAAAAASAAAAPDLSAGSQYYQQPPEVIPSSSNTDASGSGGGSAIVLPSVPDYGTTPVASPPTTVATPITAPISSGPVSVPISQSPTSRSVATAGGTNTHTPPQNFGYSSTPTTSTPVPGVANTGGSAILRVNQYTHPPASNVIQAKF